MEMTISMDFEKFQNLVKERDNALEKFNNLDFLIKHYAKEKEDGTWEIKNKEKFCASVERYLKDGQFSFYTIVHRYLEKQDE